MTYYHSIILGKQFQVKTEEKLAKKLVNPGVSKEFKSVTTATVVMGTLSPIAIFVILKYGKVDVKHLKVCYKLLGI